MPKLRKYPKQPKQSASPAVWERYIDRIKEVDKHNAPIRGARNRKKNLIETARKLKMKGGNKK